MIQSLLVLALLTIGVDAPGVFDLEPTGEKVAIRRPSQCRKHRFLLQQTHLIWRGSSGWPLNVNNRVGTIGC